MRDGRNEKAKGHSKRPLETEGADTPKSKSKKPCTHAHKHPFESDEEEASEATGGHPGDGDITQDHGAAPAVVMEAKVQSNVHEVYGVCYICNIVRAAVEVEVLGGWVQNGIPRALLYDLVFFVAPQSPFRQCPNNRSTAAGYPPTAVGGAQPPSIRARCE